MKHILFSVLLFFFLTTTAMAAAININTADKVSLETLSGIGSVKAEAIMTYRKAHKFKSIEELSQVEGIGEKTVAKLKEQITVTDK